MDRRGLGFIPATREGKDASLWAEGLPATRRWDEEFTVLKVQKKLRDREPEL